MTHVTPYAFFIIDVLLVDCDRIRGTVPFAYFTLNALRGIEYRHSSPVVGEFL